MTRPRFFRRGLPEVEWHGWGSKDGDLKLYIGPVPLRKAIAIHSLDGGVMDVHAYFRSERDARVVMAILDHFILKEPLPDPPSDEDQAERTD
jgi:hypothetical protein